MSAKTQRAYIRVVVIAIMFLLLVLIGFNIIPATASNDDLVIQQHVDLQLTLSEFLAKDVLILAYRPLQYHSQAVSELQTVLPVFQQAQGGILHGDASLGLPPNPPSDVQQSLLTAQPDYTAIVAAIKAILANPDGQPDPIQINIVMQHESHYTTTMYQASVLLQQHAEATKIQLIVIRCAITGLMVLIVGLNYAFVTRPVYNKLARDEKERELTTHSIIEKQSSED